MHVVVYCLFSPCQSRLLLKRDVNCDAANLFDMIEFSAAQVCGSCMHLAAALLLELFLESERGIFHIFCCICRVGGNHNLECLCVPGVSIISVFRNSLIRKTYHKHPFDVLVVDAH